SPCESRSSPGPNMNSPLQAKRAFSFVWKNNIIICLDITLKLTESFFKKDCDDIT
ncbi:Hypothetical protein F387_01907, partial [Wohlfahrtiimonas chitiniclastica SH04]